MREDSVTVFRKYANLMKYEPSRPEERHRLRIDDDDDITEMEQRELGAILDAEYEDKLAIKKINDKKKKGINKAKFNFGKFSLNVYKKDE